MNKAEDFLKALFEYFAFVHQVSCSPVPEELNQHVAFVSMVNELYFPLAKHLVAQGYKEVHTPSGSVWVPLVEGRPPLFMNWSTDCNTIYLSCVKENK